MSHKFVVLVNDELRTYENFDEIPMVIDNVVEFSPEFIPPPHTEEEHQINEQWQEKFRELIKRETK